MNSHSRLSLRTRLKNSFRQRKEIDVILQHTPKSSEILKYRINWLFDLIEWIRLEGMIKHDLDFTTGAPQAARVRYLLQILDRNEDWKKKVASCLRSIIKDTKGLELFIQTGLFTEDHLLGELMGRINEKVLPQEPQQHELSFIFKENFHSSQDVEWFQLLDASTFSRILELFNFEVSAEEENWNSLKSDCEQALLLLGLQVQGLGLTSDIRKRLTISHFEKMPFHQLPEAIERFITEPVQALRLEIAEQIESQVINCKLSLREVQNHLDQNGVSVQIVYKIDRLEHLLNRILDILYLLRASPLNINRLADFIRNLVADNIERRSILSFLNKSFSLLSRKIVERNAESGEHYITRDSKEYVRMINSALGGGVVTSFTAFVKIILHYLSLGNFYYGLVSSLNYSVSFLIIHFNHFTLGTKQPSTTAPALAAKMQSIESPEDLGALVDEIVHIFRSQFAAVLGNIIGVVPVTYLIAWISFRFGHHAILSPHEAEETLKSFSILGPTPLYAFFTGILLWASSLFSGWCENWYTFHRLSPALAANRRLHFIFGATRSRALSIFLKKNFLGISSNISLGFLLGLSPALLQFIGIHLEVRHVTLSSGAVAAALASLSREQIFSSQLLEAVLGVLTMGILNISVAFSLALFLAVKARQVRAPKRRLIYKAVFRRIYQRPLSFIWPASQV